MRKQKVIGGQAVMEGVMMKSPTHVAIAVRKPNGKIKVKKEEYTSWTKKNKFFALPVIRGFVVFIETIGEGSRALSYSAKEALEEEDVAESSGWIMVVSMIIALALALLLFKFVPLGAAQFFSNYYNLSNRFIFNLIEGLIKIFILVSYIYLISKMKDIQRIFQYHGAEHKVVHCYEKEKKVSVKLAKKFPCAHSRCGTSFLLFVVLVSVIVYLLIPLGYSIWSKFLWRLALLPLIAGLSYEILKLGANHPKNFIFRWLSWPGILLQNLTTAEPDDKQLEVAVKALKAVA